MPAHVVSGQAKRVVVISILLCLVLAVDLAPGIPWNQTSRVSEGSAAAGHPLRALGGIGASGGKGHHRSSWERSSEDITAVRSRRCNLQAAATLTLVEASGTHATNMSRAGNSPRRQLDPRPSVAERGGSIFLASHPKKRSMEAACFADVRYGERNDSIRLFQHALINHGGSLPAGATGLYGRQTQAAYNEFLKKRQMPKDIPLESAFYALGLQAAGPLRTVRLASPLASGKISHKYGVRHTRYASGFHTGVDYAAPAGASVYAVRSGRIEVAKDDPRGFGKWVGLRADNGRLYVYAHLSRIKVRGGQSVLAGNELGTVGVTGRAIGPHLHFEDHPQGPFKYGDVRAPEW
ncbi:M23 family metallopeptidase [Streptomyces sp. NPDC003038]|uniref:M23 family metallopeptidase n=1 Tax=unclassified Streptomyces TaxID=2593676 RepID=UPI00339E5001